MDKYTCMHAKMRHVGLAVSGPLSCAGCEAPASQEPVWECHMRSPCGSGPKNTISHGEQVMYGWGRDAPGMHLPEGAGFSVGPRTGIRMAVLQVGTK